MSEVDKQPRSSASSQDSWSTMSSSSSSSSSLPSKRAGIPEKSFLRQTVASASRANSAQMRRKELELDQRVRSAMGQPTSRKDRHHVRGRTMAFRLKDVREPLPLVTEEV